MLQNCLHVYYRPAQTKKENKFKSSKYKGVSIHGGGSERTIQRARIQFTIYKQTCTQNLVFERCISSKIYVHSTHTLLVNLHQILVITKK